jgi:hypothetical protein
VAQRLRREEAKTIRDFAGIAAGIFARRRRMAGCVGPMRGDLLKDACNSQRFLGAGFALKSHKQ